MADDDTDRLPGLDALAGLTEAADRDGIDQIIDRLAAHAELSDSSNGDFTDRWSDSPLTSASWLDDELDDSIPVPGLVVPDQRADQGDRRPARPRRHRRGPDASRPTTPGRTGGRRPIEDPAEWDRGPRRRRLVPVLAFVVVLIIGVGVAIGVANRDSGKIIAQPPPPTAAPVDPFDGLDAAQQQSAVKACTTAYAEYNGDAPEEVTGFDLRAATAEDPTKLVTVVLTDGTTRLVCNVAPSKGLREPVRDRQPVDVSTEDYYFSSSDTSNYGLPSGDLVWAGGRAPAGVTAISYQWPDGHIEPASIDSDGYWVMQYAPGKVFTRGNYTKLAPVAIKTTFADGRVVDSSISWASDGTCAAVNLGGC